jgi:hypothetical protein
MNKLIIILFLFCSFLTNANDLKLEINQIENKDTFEIELFIINKGNKAINILNSNYASYWCWTYPCINFIAETKINGEWKKIRETKNMRCGNYQNWYESKSVISIKSTEKIKIGTFSFIKGIDSWYTLIESKKIRLSAEYLIGGLDYKDDLLTTFNINNTSLKSNFIEFDFKFDAKKTSVDAQLASCFKWYVFSQNFEDFFKNYVVIDKPKNEKEVLEFGLKGTNIDFSKTKIIGWFFAREQKTPMRVIVFKIGGDLYLAFSTQVYRKISNDKSGKYIFNIQLANDFIYY